MRYSYVSLLTRQYLFWSDVMFEYDIPIGRNNHQFHINHCKLSST